MQWPGQSQFVSAQNVTWTVNGKPAGTARSYDNLTFVVVFNAGKNAGNCKVNEY